MEEDKEEESNPIDNIQTWIEAFHIVKNHVTHRCAKYTNYHSIKTPYEIVFKNTMGTQWANDDIIITPGNPPVVIITDAFVMEYLAGRKSAPFFNRRIEYAMEKLHLMHRTLSHPIPLAYAISLKNDAKKWAKELVPEIRTKIAKNHLEYFYAVTVKDKITGTSFTSRGDNLEECKEEATLRVSKMVFEQEDLEELHDFILGMKAKKEQKPSEISLGGKEGETRENIRYD